MMKPKQYAKTQGNQQQQALESFVHNKTAVPNKQSWSRRTWAKIDIYRIRCSGRPHVPQARIALERDNAFWRIKFTSLSVFNINIKIDHNNDDGNDNNTKKK